MWISGGTLARFRVTFAKELMGLRFPIASVEVRHARDADRALRVAELKFSRHYGMDWHMRAECATSRRCETL